VSEFEYITVLLSIIFGLAMSHLLRGIGTAIFHRKPGSWDWVHGLWVVNTFILLAVNWWVTFQFQGYAAERSAAAEQPASFWSVEIFLILLLWAVFLYMPSILLFPPDEDEYEDYNAIYHRNRFFLMGTFVGFGVMDIVQTAARGALFDPPFYLLFVGHYIAVFLLAMFVRRRGVQLFAAAWVLVTLVVWTFGVRRLLA
jgi:hypothetical protein